uniref:Uncharacterized protein n=1 Tax=Eutreptiella gymnastica TaxID=73025 RepID=A0A7S4G1I5_9EUGL
MLMDPAVPRCAEPVFAAFGMPAVKNISAPSVPASARCHGKLLKVSCAVVSSRWEGLHGARTTRRFWHKTKPENATPQQRPMTRAKRWTKGAEDEVTEKLM